MSEHSRKRLSGAGGRGAESRYHRHRLERRSHALIIIGPRHEGRVTDWCRPSVRPSVRPHSSKSLSAESSSQKLHI